MDENNWANETTDRHFNIVIRWKKMQKFKHFQAITNLADPALVSSNVGPIRTGDGKFYSIRSNKHHLKRGITLLKWMSIMEIF